MLKWYDIQFCESKCCFRGHSIRIHDKIPPAILYLPVNNLVFFFLNKRLIVKAYNLVLVSARIFSARRQSVYRFSGRKQKEIFFNKKKEKLIIKKKYS